MRKQLVSSQLQRLHGHLSIDFISLIGARLYNASIGKASIASSSVCASLRKLRETLQLQSVGARVDFFFFSIGNKRLVCWHCDPCEIQALALHPESMCS